MIFHSSFQNSYLWLPLIGLIVGFVGSMIGGGGGFVFPPALMLIFKVPAHVAVATSLAATLPICLLGAAAHYNKGNLNVSTGLTFGLAGIIGALSGVIVIRWLTPDQLENAFGIYLTLLALFMIFVNNKDKSKTRKTSQSISLSRVTPKSSFFGFTGGLISGTFGTSGTAPVLAGLLAINLPLKFVAGTSLMIIFINTVSALAGHLILGVIDLTLVLFLTIGTIIGALAGPKLTTVIKIGSKEGLIRYAFASLILVFGVVMIIF